MIETATVIEMIKPDIAKVELIRTSACGECKVCSADKKITITAINSINAKIGDKVNIEIKDVKKNAILLVYILPIILIFVGFYIGKFLFKEEILSAITAMILPVIYIITAIIKEKKKKSINCSIIKIIDLSH